MGKTRTAASLAALLLVSSCQWAGDTKAVRVPFANLKQRLEESQATLKRAIEEGSLDRTPAAIRALGERFDEISAQSSAMNLLDREHLAINIATARRCLTAIDRYCVAGDQELVRTQFDQLEPTIGEIQVLLDRAIKTTTAE